MKGICFCGHNLQAASIVIPHDIIHTEEIEEQLKALKNTKIPLENTIGFQFTCIGRGEGLHNARHIEARLFRKHFPGVPLFGMFVNGELGYNFLPDFSKPDGDKDYTLMGQYHDDSPYTWDMPQSEHAYSSIFALLSWNSVQENA